VNSKNEDTKLRTQTNWKNHGDPANIEILQNGVRLSRKTNQRSYAKYLLQVPESINLSNHYLRVRAEVKIEEEDTSPVGPGAGLMIWFLNTSGNSITQYHTVIPLRQGRKDDVLKSQSFLEFPEKSRSFYLALINRDSSGKYFLSKTQFDLVKQTSEYKLSVALVAGLWLTVALLSLRALSAKAGKWRALVLIALISIIAVGVILPVRLDSLLTFSIPSIFSNSQVFWTLIYKAGHFSFFFAASLVLLLWQQHIGITKAFCISALTIFAIATEGVQLHLVHRHSEWTDFLLDLAGIGGALLFSNFINAWKKRCTSAPP